MKKYNRKKGRNLIIAGIVCIVLALGLAAYNLIQDIFSGSGARDVLEQMEDGDPSGLIDSNREMPTVTIDGVEYIGRIKIPVVDIDLPVASKWSYSILNIAPGRYKGSVYRDDIVIAGHNYRNHFGPFTHLSVGDTVIFEDMEHNMFEYTIGEIEVIDPYDVKTMTDSEWDMTLFTCTLGGQTRLTVRCQRN